MCGVFAMASVGLQKHAGFEPRLEHLMARGPDNIGARRYEHAVLCHTRLAVLDSFRTSDQPLVNGPLAVVCNGEVLNYQSLRALDEFPYRTTSDCESVLHVYATNGVDGFSRLDGFFSFVLYDDEKKCLLLHRDGMGKKPLFYAVDGDRFVCASNVTAVMANLRSRPAIRRDQIEHYRQHGYVHPAQSLFHGIHPVLPGQLVRLDQVDGTVSTVRLVQRRSMASVDWDDASASQRAIDQAVAEAVAKRTAGLDHPVLIFSGGIDSTVLAENMRAVAGRVTLVTMKQPIRWLNDEPFAREAAAKLDAPLRRVWPWRRAAEQVELALGRLDQPFAPPSFVYLSLLAQAAREYGNVLFTGDGADEVFYGYRPFKDWVAPAPSPPTPMDLSVGPPHAFALSPYGTQQGVIDLWGHAFVKVDKATAENQMEARCPFLDWDLVALLRTAPRAYWERQGGELKVPLKRYLASRGYRPGFIHRRKLGFAFPFRYLLAPAFPEMLRTVIRSREVLASVGYEISPARTFAFDEFWRSYVLAHYLRRVRLA